MKKIEIKKAIVSVHNKAKLEILIKYFLEFNIQVFSTGGTYRFMNEISKKLDLFELSSLTKFDEILGGRVKTLHPNIFGSILADTENTKHKQELLKYGITKTDLVVVNLYPFEETLKSNKKNEKLCLENIDIGGTSLIRAAAKNFNDTIVLSSPQQYEEFIKIGKNNSNRIQIEKSRAFALDAFNETAYYDSIISSWLQERTNFSKFEKKTVPLKKITKLKYGENPHQHASLYNTSQNQFTKISGKELSYNNINDFELAMEVAGQFEKHCCAIIKHGSPCGVAIHNEQEKAYKKALNCDPISAFGGIISFNSKVNEKTAKLIIKLFTEIVVAPSFSVEAIKVLSEKKNLILIKSKIENSRISFNIRLKSTKNHLLIQDEDNRQISNKDLIVKTKKIPTKREYDDLIFAFKVCKFVNSNAIVIAKNKSTTGICGGQTSRIDSVKIALSRAKIKSKNDVLASDGFFPFPDAVELCKKYNISSIIQPGGSRNDNKVIEITNSSKMSMIFTSIRHFKH